MILRCYLAYDYSTKRLHKSVTNMNLNQLLAFHYAADTMNFSQAATRLNVTQPAVSAQIRNLEEDLGVKLFARLGKKLVLTEPGEVLLKYTRKIFGLREEAMEVMEQLRQVKRGTLKLGTARTYARHLMPPLLAQFQKRFPQVNIVLVEGNSLEIVRSLKSLAVEVAVAAFAGSVKQVKFNFFKTEDLVPIVHPHHPLAFKDDVPVKRLVQEPIILREKGSGTRRMVNDLFRRHRLKPKVVFETSNVEVIKAQVARGVGISFLTRSAVYEDVLSRRLAMLSLENERLRLDVYTATLENHHLSRPGQAFLELLYSGQVPRTIPNLYNQ